MIDNTDITRLQADVRKELANGAPGLKATSGCCAAVQFEKPSRSTRLQERLDKARAKLAPKFTPQPCCKPQSTAEFTAAAEKVMGFVNPKVEERVIPGVQHQVTGEHDIRYGLTAIKKLIVADMNGRGIDMGQVRIDFDELGAVVVATGKPS